MMTRAVPLATTSLSLLAFAGAASAQIPPDTPLRPVGPRVTTQPAPDTHVDPRATPIEHDERRGTAIEAIPEHRQAGRHTLVLPVLNRKRVKFSRIFGCGGATDDVVVLHDPEALGFAQVEISMSAQCAAYLAQLAVSFDRAQLDEVPDRRLVSAVLRYDEAQYSPCTLWAVPLEGYGIYPVGPTPCWANGEGEREHKPAGCIEVRVPYGDWPNNSMVWRGGMALATPQQAGATNRIEPTAWDVSAPVNRQMFGGPGLGEQRFVGFALTPWVTSIDMLTGDDNTRCFSRITNIRLEVTYDVPRTGPLQPVN